MDVFLVCFSVTWYGFFAYTNFESSDVAIEAMNNQFLTNKCITVQYAFKKEGKGERHGTAAERLFAAQARKNNVLHVNARPSSTHGPVRCTAARSRLPRIVPGPVHRCTGSATSTAQVHTSASTCDACDGCAWWCVLLPLPPPGGCFRLVDSPHHHFLGLHLGRGCPRMGRCLHRCQCSSRNGLYTSLSVPVIIQSFLMRTYLSLVSSQVKAF